jgi:hypothetical protein
MLPKARRAMLGVLLALTATLAASCGRKSDHTPVFPVTGRLLLEGKPAEKAMVFFCPLDNHDSHAPKPVGTVASDGSFTLSTFLANDGAPAGEFAVTVVWPVAKDPENGPDRLKGHCGNPAKSPWHVRVEPKTNDVGTLDLQAWPGATPAKEQSPAAKAPAKPPTRPAAAKKADRDP